MAKKFANIDWKYYLLFIIVELMAIILLSIWIIGITDQIIGLLQNTLQDIGKLKDLADVIKDYGTVSLTLFGFTFIGGIFEIRKFGSDPIDKFTKGIMKMIFSLSIVFLFTFIIFYILYSLIYPNPFDSPIIIVSLLLIGIGLFILGILVLLAVLIKYLYAIHKKETVIDVVD
jgi:hypothetical protein